MTSPSTATLHRPALAGADLAAVRAKIADLERADSDDPATNRQIATLYRELFPSACWCRRDDCPLCNPEAVSCVKGGRQ